MWKDNQAGMYKIGIKKSVKSMNNQHVFIEDRVMTMIFQKHINRIYVWLTKAPTNIFIFSITDSLIENISKFVICAFI